MCFAAGSVYISDRCCTLMLSGFTLAAPWYLPADSGRRGKNCEGCTSRNYLVSASRMLHHM